MRLAEEITSFLNSVKNISRVGICYYDLNNFFNYNEEGVKINRGHYCAFCESARALPNGRSYCEKSDRIQAVELARQYKEPFFYECHMGMKELLIPLMRNDVLIGVLFIGQCRLNDDNDDEIKSNTVKMGGNPDIFLKLYNELPKTETKELLEIGKLISKYFDVVLLNSELLSDKITPTNTNPDITESIKNYIQMNYKHPLSLSNIAEKFHFNASYLSRLFSSKYNVTITEYINQTRIERAKTLLTSTNISIENIAINTGFSDANYFSRVFRKAVGASPGRYRQKIKQPGNISKNA